MNQKECCLEHVNTLIVLFTYLRHKIKVHERYCHNYFESGTISYVKYLFSAIPSVIGVGTRGDKEGPKKTKLKWQEWEHRSLSVRKMMTS